MLNVFSKEICPSYITENKILILGDTFSVLAAIEPGVVDMILTTTMMTIMIIMISGMNITVWMKWMIKINLLTSLI